MPEFNAFFQAHAPSVWNYLRRLTGDPERSADLFQRVFLKAWSRFETRQRERERGWIFTIAVNEARDDLRRRRRERSRWEGEEALSVQAAETRLPPEDQELLHVVMRALQDLPPQHRELFLLVRYHGFTFAEAAAVAGVGLSAAKMTVIRAHERLMRILSDRLHLGSIL